MANEMMQFPLCDHVNALVELEKLDGAYFQVS